MLESKILKFHCKTAILLKNNYLNKEDFVRKIVKDLKGSYYESFFFSSVMYPTEIKIECKDRLLTVQNYPQNLKEDVSKKMGLVYYMYNQNSNYSNPENFNIAYEAGKFQYKARMHTEKKRLRNMINNDMNNLFLVNEQKFIRFNIREEMFLCEDWMLRHELVKFYSHYNFTNTKSNLIEKVQEYCNTHRDFLIKPSKNLNSYKDIYDILNSKYADYSKREELRKYLWKELIVQKSKNLEMMYKELKELTNTIKNDKKKFQFLMKLDAKGSRIWFKKLLIKNTIDPALILLTFKLFYCKEEIDGMLESYESLIEHINKFYL